MSQEELMQIFKFDQQDLAANQQGHLSAQQQARWASAGQWSKTVLQKTFAVLAAFIVLIFGILYTISSQHLLWGSLASVGLALLVGGGVWLIAQRQNQAEPEEMPTVGHREGLIHLKTDLDEHDQGLSRRYRVEIEGTLFQLFTQEQFEALKNGEPYALYFMDDENKYIVSIEKLPL